MRDLKEKLKEICTYLKDLDEIYAFITDKKKETTTKMYITYLAIFHKFLVSNNLHTKYNSYRKIKARDLKGYCKSLDDNIDFSYIYKTKNYISICAIIKHLTINDLLNEKKRDIELYKMKLITSEQFHSFSTKGGKKIHKSNITIENIYDIENFYLNLFEVKIEIKKKNQTNEKIQDVGNENKIKDETKNEANVEYKTIKNRTRIRDYLIVAIIINTGCRNSAVLDIRLNNAILEPKCEEDKYGMNIKERFFYTNEKETVSDMGIGNLYALPKDQTLLRLLDAYRMERIISLGINPSNNEELKKHPLFDIKTRESVINIFKRYFEKRIRPDDFRGIINYYRDEYAKKTCNDCQTIKRDLKILLNHHDGGDVNSDFYLWKMNFPVNRVALYDQYHPY